MPHVDIKLEEKLRFNLTGFTGGGDISQYLANLPPAAVSEDGGSIFAQLKLKVTNSAGDFDHYWNPSNIRFKTQDFPQTLFISLDVEYDSSIPPTDRPTFFLSRISFDKQGDEHRILKVDHGLIGGGGSKRFPKKNFFRYDTNVIAITFLFSPYKDDLSPDASFNLHVVEKKSGVEKNCDPQVGNDPP